MVHNEITICLRCDVTPDVFKPQRYVIISLLLHLHTSTLMLMARVLCAKENSLLKSEGTEKSVIIERLRDCLVLEAPFQSLLTKSYLTGF